MWDAQELPTVLKEENKKEKIYTRDRDCQRYESYLTWLNGKENIMNLIECDFVVGNQALPHILHI